MTFIESSTSHAKRMDRMYRVQRHIYDLTRKYYLLARDRTIREMHAKPGDRVLELGCGTGRNLKLIAKTYPQLDLAGLDISEEMLISARRTLARGKIDATLVAGDATRFEPSDFGKADFDHILLSYALSMIPQWEQTIVSATQALAPGGTLHIVDFGQQEKLPHIFSRALFAWLRAFHVIPRATLREASEQAAQTIGGTCRFKALYGGYAWQIEIRRPADA
ncbi:class I SAM-dependent methyltransferase [Rhizobium sp. L1K21]|uniref:class I SAM-dependent methyltransferase n=1 Tax=Rhizobium sp. L1K21 TaxID=2954933 RepID=UPI0020926E58|nr:class I SAM-dependent methyltransferase [Rhizobium sp. L1K21]MCO6185623.1 class I SAM-dependent methyltransferase [Rhizobium sp. L1K21]